MNKYLIFVLFLLVITVTGEKLYAQEYTGYNAWKDTTTAFLYSTEMKFIFLKEGWYSHDKVEEINNLDSIKFGKHQLNDLLIIREGLAVYFFDDFFAVAYDHNSHNIYRLKGFLENDYFWLKSKCFGLDFAKFDTPKFKFSNLDKALDKKGLYICPEMISRRRNAVIMSPGHIITNKLWIFWLNIRQFNRRKRVEEMHQKKPPFRPSKYDKLSCFSWYYPTFD